MNKIVCCLVLLLAVSYVSAQACFAQNCVAVGQACSLACINATQCVSQCPAPLLCSSMDGTSNPTCVASIEGKTCVSNADCTPSNFASFLSQTDPVTGAELIDLVHPPMQCRLGKCTVERSGMVAGDGCVANEECVSNDCDDGTCVGAPFNFPCTSTSECSVGLVCNGGRCAPRNLEGQPCGSDGDCSSANMLCHKPNGGATGFCLTKYRLGFGVPCTQSDRCQINYQCARIRNANEQFSTSRQCISLSEDSISSSMIGQVCNGTASACGDLLTCYCNTNSGEFTCQNSLGLTEDCRAKEGAYISCLESKGCQRTSAVNKEGSCARECLGAFADYVNCVGTEYQALMPSACALQRVSSASVLDVFFF